ncbi:MFS transporter [Tundrisphaera lichenicola]|uniref:MFS transporter n=1 Tax=Tundrisphaera lichenicola TaxID=2029860 RepID=UPI003EB7D6D1
MAKSSSSSDPSPVRPPLDRARAKAYARLLPLLFFSYMIAYVDRSNVAIAALTMKRDLPAFTDAVIGFASGIFFVGYFLLEIPGTLIVERWSARKWICRIMVTWGFVAALTAIVTVPWHFYVIRFLLGLAEAGFYPGVIVYLTHWFPSRDRARALAYFFVATPIAQFVSPKLSNILLKIGTDEMVNGVMVHHPEVWGMEGWQWVYIAWGIPAVLLGIVVLFYLTDRPAQAKWLDPEEREALELELKREKELHAGSNRHMTVLQALSHPKVLILAAAYFFVVTGNYGIEFFMPSILESLYSIKLDQITWLVILPPIGSLVGQLVIGWSSDKTGERRLHTALPIYMGAAALGVMVLMEKPPLWLTVGLFIAAMTGLKAYLPAFWSLPNLFLAESAAAGSIGLINSVGNLGGAVGPSVMGVVKTTTGSFRGGLTYLAVSMAISATIIMMLGLGKRVPKANAHIDPLAEALAEPT